MEIKILLKQHVGVPCKPIVAVGDEVKKGQLIAEPQGLGANIHSSVYGLITEVSENFIKVKPHENQPDEYVKLKESDNKLELIKEAGIVGAGGAGFPTHVKLDVNLQGGYVIANGAECEPLLAHNLKLMEEHPEIIVRGLKYIKEITNASKGYIAVKEKYKKAVKALKKACSLEKDIELKLLPDMYPAGDERVIVREILGVELKPGQLPLEANAVVQNVETLKHIVNAIEKRKPFITKDLTVAGRVKDARNGKVFFDVPIGEPVGKYINLCGGYIEPHGEIVLGGPFTGKSGTEQTPVTKTLGGILVAMPFPQETRKMGLLVCECGASEERLREIAESMGSEVVAVEKCKRMVEVNGRFRCEKPGVCPGQAEKVLALKNKGIEVLLVSTCGD
ncbi:proline reductase-associated electron transfer protein PrdC [Anoxybacter fermentans]|uniref:Proline reductase-associated electron transfer protein PrdC n=2 Tax=Anoxybacter fermentans TaxID=1323375 RepID=A0A3S9T269_9FIRM|nr:proline reductase-associated electron transfer protein PrdC [Anoxybacter fermentans]AZR74631.1 proline reductase-associated electron transfer protein PrdC [Anoxybacter fermentans]